MTKPAFNIPDRALENEWSDVLPGLVPPSGVPSATTRTSGLRPAIPHPPPPSQRLPPPSRLPEIHPADASERTIQRSVNVAELDFEDADRTKEIAPDQVSRLAATAFPSDVPPAMQRPTLPVPPMRAPLPPQAFPSLSELASHARPEHQQAARALDMGQAMRGAVDAHLRAPNRPMPWVATPPLPRNQNRMLTALIVAGAFFITAALALGGALWVLHH